MTPLLVCLESLGLQLNLILFIPVLIDVPVAWGFLKG